jgi:hypothetical protein
MNFHYLACCDISTEFSPELIDKAIAHGQEIAADPKKWV